MTPHWDIRRGGRAWDSTEFRSRADLPPEKLEIHEGKLLFDEEERINLLGLLLENVGADRAVRMGQPHVWVDAVRDAHPRLAQNRFLSSSFNRWMLVLWCLNLLVIGAVMFLPGRLSPPSPPVPWLIIAAVVSAVVSVGVNLFTRRDL